MLKHVTNIVIILLFSQFDRLFMHFYNAQEAYQLLFCTVKKKYFHRLFGTYMSIGRIIQICVVIIKFEYISAEISIASTTPAEITMEPYLSLGRCSFEQFFHLVDWLKVSNWVSNTFQI